MIKNLELKYEIVTQCVRYQTVRDRVRQIAVAVRTAGHFSDNSGELKTPGVRTGLSAADSRFSQLKVEEKREEWKLWRISKMTKIYLCLNHYHL